MKKRDEIIVDAIIQRDLTKLDKIAIDMILTSTNNEKYTEWLSKLQVRVKDEGKEE